MRLMITTLCILALALGAVGCSGRTEAVPGAQAAEHPSSHPARGGELDLPLTARRNLGITFARAEERAVERTFRIPGRFVLTESAVRAHHAPLPSRVELHVRESETVEPGQQLVTLRSPALRERQSELRGALDRVAEAEAAVRVAEAELKSAGQRLGTIRKRIRILGEARIRKAELDTERGELDASLPVLKARVSAAQIVRRSAQNHAAGLLRTLAEYVNLSEASLSEKDVGREQPKWETLDRVEIRAATAGLVQRVSAKPGSWVEMGAPLVEVVDPRAIRLEATALQGDIGRFRDGHAARVWRPRSTEEPADGTVRLGATGDPTRRTFPVFVKLDKPPRWARAGLAATVEVVVDGDGAREVAVPRSALVKDGTDIVLFRRDPHNPDRVVRVAPDVGPDDGLWVVVYSGVAPGDEVVSSGAYELKLAVSNAPRPTGHMHGDGSFHDSEHKSGN